MNRRRTFPGSRRFPSVPPFRLLAYSTVYIDKDVNLEDGDKVLLPTHVLEKIMRSFATRELPLPMIFEVVNKHMNRKMHCGVLEFTGPAGKVILPQWMMQSLLLEDGKEARLRLRPVKKVTYARVQPHSWRFTEIPQPKAALEFALRKFTTLTANSTIAIHHDNQTHLLTVKAVKPGTYGSVIDTSLSVEFDPPVEQKPEVKVDQLEPNVPVSGSVKSGEYAYYSVKLEHSQGVKIVLTTVSGDPDIFVSTMTREPTEKEHIWSSRKATEVNEVIVPSTHPKASSWYYIGVYGYKADASFSLVVENYLEAPALVQQSSTASQASTGSLLVSPDSQRQKGFSFKQGRGKGRSLGSISSEHPDAKQCDNCKAFVSKSAYNMHVLRCARTNWFCPICEQAIRVQQKANHAHCPQCQELMEPQEIEKHIELRHRNQRCDECGVEVSAADMASHLLNSCSMRRVNCKWCTVLFPFKEVNEHQEYCGSKTAPCATCGKGVRRKEMVIHNAIEHNINPSLDPSDMAAIQAVYSNPSSVPDTYSPYRPGLVTAAAAPSPAGGLPGVSGVQPRPRPQTHYGGPPSSTAPADADLNAAMLASMQASDLDYEAQLKAAMQASLGADSASASTSSSSSSSSSSAASAAAALPKNPELKSDDSKYIDKVLTEEQRAMALALEESLQDHRSKNEEEEDDMAGWDDLPDESALDDAFDDMHAPNSPSSYECPYCLEQIPGSYEVLQAHMTQHDMT